MAVRDQELLSLPRQAYPCYTCMFGIRPVIGWKPVGLSEGI